MSMCYRRAVKKTCVMRICIIGALILVISLGRLSAQEKCGSYAYQQSEWQLNPATKLAMEKVESFIQRQINRQTATDGKSRGEHLPLITIPVVVHVLYHDASQNISDEDIYSELKLLNQCFRRQNADSANTPSRFKSLAADCEVEFKLAITDPRKRSTNGIIRTYTPVTKWEADDKMKYTSEAGDDAWDQNNYMNIWICNLNRMLGYGTFPGGDPAKDGIVMNYLAFKQNKTLVHEAGHWMGLKHLWGDTYCGDDMVDDTPKQSTFTSGCPTGIRISCSNGPDGDMYMNYMDFTNDACTNLFTEGQKTRMRSLFGLGGARASLLGSYALQPPLINEIPLPAQPPKWYFANFYPNPTTGAVTLDVSFDVRWVGKTISVSNVQGIILKQIRIDAKVMQLDLGSLKPGIYFLNAKKDDGTTIKQKLVKM